MKIYQLVACGYFEINHARYTIHSDKCYRSQKQAREAIPDFYKFVTTSKKIGDTMVMSKLNLRVLLHPLELINNNHNKKKENKK